MIELLSNAEMAQADRQTIAGGVAGIDLMERAGLAVADAVSARHPAGSRIVVVAGPGNNGGDGFVAARLLAERGYRVRCCWWATRRGSKAMRRLRRNSGRARSLRRCRRPGSPGDRRHDRRGDRRPVRRRPRPAGRGPTARHDREHERAAGADRCGGPAKRDQRNVRGGDGNRREGRADHHLLSQETRASAAAGTTSLRRGLHRRYRHCRFRAGANCSENLREHACTLARAFSGAARGRTQI